MSRVSSASLALLARSVGPSERHAVEKDSGSAKSRSTSAESSPPSSAVLDGPPSPFITADDWQGGAVGASELMGEESDADAARRCLLPGFLDELLDGALVPPLVSLPPGLEHLWDIKCGPCASLSLPPPPPPGLGDGPSGAKDLRMPPPPLLPPELGRLGVPQGPPAALPAFLLMPPPQALPSMEKLAWRPVPGPPPAAPPSMSARPFATMPQSPPKAPALSVAELVAPPPPQRPALGSTELPTTGSVAHGTGECRPCAFVHTKGCTNGVTCNFCHLCDAGEKKRRRRQRSALAAVEQGAMRT
mmetsp:Transcript_103177/g.298509  ORF Transcript_103177/g.298509 Transcript_103177/m.298509 type:complete len:303 (+) Transcript_103177:81-989(+)